MQSSGMPTGISIILTPPDRHRLEAVIRNRNTAQKHVWRAAIVLLSANGVGTTEIVHRTGTSKTRVWRWHLLPGNHNVMRGLLDCLC